ncbi:MAG TPA: hypothetical protein VIE43_07435 [Thermoanaerobaculia bacterium]|jgi:hypothetical protein|nr:hypothetical protein [Thermoanaerobaculia bacterium]
MKEPESIRPRGDQDLTYSQARRQLHRAADDLEDFQLRMQGILGTLSSAADHPEAAKPLEDEEMDARTEMHAVIRCVMADCIDPAIRDLRDMLIATEGAGAPKP